MSSTAIRITAGLAVALVVGSMGCSRAEPPGPEKPRATPSISSVPPILLLTRAGSPNPFGPYLAEILRTEGLMLFEAADVSHLTPRVLTARHVVILGEIPVDAVQIALLAGWVRAGGRLIAMRPTPKLARMLGVIVHTTDWSAGYLRVEPHEAPTASAVTDPIQVFGDEADLEGGVVVARVQQARDGGPSVRSIVRQSFGRGTALLWGFDLARSVAFTRQGNPSWANLERDGEPGIRARDAFVGWMDIELLQAPQADLQMRLLTAQIRDLMPASLVPQLWYFPGDAPGLLIATSDAHGQPAASVDAVLAAIERYHGTASVFFEPPRRSSNALRTAGATLRDRLVARWRPFPVDRDHRATADEIERWRRAGHEIAPHPDVDLGIQEGYEAAISGFAREGYRVTRTSTRVHNVSWRGWVETAKIQQLFGFRLTFDYYAGGQAFRKSDGSWAHGFFAGSGLPMRLVDSDGRILSIYQLATSLTDEQLLRGAYAGWERLDADQAVRVSEDLLDSTRRFHEALVVQFHADFLNPANALRPSASRWLEGTLAAAVARALPITSGERYLSFVECRAQTIFDEVRWNEDDRQLMFTVDSGAPGCPIAVVVPVTVTPADRLRPVRLRAERVFVDGRPSSVRFAPGVDQEAVWVTAPAGRHAIRVVYAPQGP